MMRSHLRLCNLHRKHAVDNALSINGPDSNGSVSCLGGGAVRYSHGLSNLHSSELSHHRTYTCLAVCIDVLIGGQTYFLHREQIGSRLSHCRLPDLQVRQTSAALPCSSSATFSRYNDDIISTMMIKGPGQAGQ
jgi:hypothetical protein